MIPLVSLAMNSAVSTTTGYSPYYLLHGRDIDLPFDDIIRPTRTTDKSVDTYVVELHEKLHDAFEITRRRIRESAERQERYYDRNTKPVTLQVGDLVLLHTPVIRPNVTRKHGQLWDGPYRIILFLGPVDVRIRQIYTRKIQDVNINRVKLLRTFDRASFNDDLTPVGQTDTSSQEEESETLTNTQPLLPTFPETYDPRDDFIFPDLPMPQSSTRSTTPDSEHTEVNSREPSIIEPQSPAESPRPLPLEPVQTPDRPIPRSPPLNFSPIIRIPLPDRSIRTRYNLRDRIPMRLLPDYVYPGNDSDNE